MRIHATLAALLTILASLAPAPAAASGGIPTVTLIVEVPDSLYGEHVLGQDPWRWEHVVEHEDGLTALALLDQVVAARGSTYTPVWYDIDGDGDQDDAFIDEIDGVRTDFRFILVGHYWALYEDGSYAAAGAAGTTVQAGETITFRYEGFPATV